MDWNGCLFTNKQRIWIQTRLNNVAPAEGPPWFWLEIYEGITSSLQRVNILPSFMTPPITETETCCAHPVCTGHNSWTNGGSVSALHNSSTQRIPQVTAVSPLNEQRWTQPGRVLGNVCLCLSIQGRSAVWTSLAIGQNPTQNQTRPRAAF